MQLSDCSYNEMVLKYEVAVGGGADKCDILRDDNKVGDERSHYCLPKKPFKGASWLRIIICGVKGRPVVNQLVNNY